MITFILHFLFRSLSGFHNGSWYGRRDVPAWIFGMAQNSVLGLSFGLLVGNEAGWLLYVSILLCVVALAGIIILHLLMMVGAYRHVHLLETVITGSFTVLLLLNGNLAGVLLSLYPGLVLHKIGVNVMAGNKWNYWGTDDPDGKYFSIGRLKIPRTPQWVRYAMAGVSLISLIWIQKINLWMLGNLSWMLDLLSR
jgi:hypothetical protein